MFSSNFMQYLGAAPAEAPMVTEATNQLGQAAKDGDVTTIKAALARGAKINHRFDDDGLTALHLAAKFDHADVAAALIVAGAKTNLRSRDPARFTPAQLAEALQHWSVSMVLGQKDLVANPLRRRYKGPALVSLGIIANTILAWLLMSPSLRWSGWTPAGQESFHDTELPRYICLALGSLALLLLVFLHMKDPGYLRRSQVAYVDDLWSGRDVEANVVADGDVLGVVWPSGDSGVFNWCHTCKLWRPEGASHCGICRRCCWRFDHHCNTVGTCVGAGNHVAFATFLLFTAISWMVMVLLVSAHFYFHGAIASLANFREVGLQNWPVYAALGFVSSGAYYSAKLLNFSRFHLGSLIWSYTTKSLAASATQEKGTWKERNSNEVMKQIWCSPCDFRSCRAPESLPLRHEELVLPTDGGKERGTATMSDLASTFSGSQSEGYSLV